MPARRDDHDLVGPKAAGSGRDSLGVLARVARRGVEEGLAAVPRAAHHLGLAGQEYGVAVAHQPLRVAHTRPAELRARITEDGDKAHQRPRRSLRKPSSVPTIVTTTSSDFLPCSFDSPPA